MKQRKRPKFKKGTYCAYCGLFDQNCEKEHVIGRTIFRSISTSGIDVDPIIVPACRKCNSDKSKYETYVSIVLTAASNKEFTKEQERGISHLSATDKDRFFNAKPIWANINGIMQQQMQISLDWSKLEKVCMYIGKGLVYEHNGNVPIGTNYTSCKVTSVPEEAEFDLQILNSLYELEAPDRIFRDNGCYSEYIKYIVTMGKDRDTAYFQIFNPLMANSQTNKSSRIFMVSLIKK